VFVPQSGSGVPPLDSLLSLMLVLKGNGASESHLERVRTVFPGLLE
jgi:hypothetical protein